MSILMDSLHTVECSRCGCTGIHACVGRRLPPPTPEEEARIDETLDRIFRKVAEEEGRFNASLQPLIDSGMVIPAVVDGEINPALPEETRVALEKIAAKQSQAIADDIDREIMEMIRKM